MYLFVPLDIFKKIRHDKGINGKLEAWLIFLGSDEPEDIVQLITEYPEFKAAYEEVYNLCLNTEKVMGIFSEELKLLDQILICHQAHIRKKPPVNENRPMASCFFTLYFHINVIVRISSRST